MRRTFSPTVTAVALALCSTLLFACMHGLVRHVSDGMHPFQIGFFRSVFGLLAISPLLVSAGPGVLRSRQPGLQLLRGALGTVALLAWFYGLSTVPIAEATALSFTNAIFASLGAVLFLGERMGTRRISAVALGLVGVMVILRPGLAAVSVSSLVVLLSAVCWGSSVIIVKRLSSTDRTVTIVAWMALMMIVSTAVPAAAVWQTPTLAQLGWLALIGGLGTLGMLAYTHALREVQATVLVPVDFMRLVWAAVIGFVAFSERPDGWTLTGGAIIIASTAYIAFREAKLARDRR